MKRGIILMICLMLPSLALSVEFAGGTGEPNDPYQIATAEQLIGIGTEPDLLDKSFILVADIDLDPNLPGGQVFEDALIAPDQLDGVGGHGGSPFSGVFDGQGYSIAHVHIVGKYGYDAGLFGTLSGLVMNLNLVDVVVSGSPAGAIAGLNHQGMILRCSVAGQVSGIDQVGGLVGALWDASIVDCVVQVQVTGEDRIGGMVGGGPGGNLIGCQANAQVSGDMYIGGLVGQHEGLIIECAAAGEVIGSDNVGGLVGISSRTSILRSAADCKVTAEHTAGGFVGRAVSGFGSFFTDCYARGSVVGSIIGGLAGEARHNDFVNCYAACELLPLQMEGEEVLVGGLFADAWVAAWAPMTVACFWDAELSGVNESVGSHPLELQLGMGLTTAQMQSREVFENAGWDFDTVWMICEGEYPRLQWEAQECDDNASQQN